MCSLHSIENTTTGDMRNVDTSPKCKKIRSCFYNESKDNGLAQVMADALVDGGRSSLRQFALISRVEGVLRVITSSILPNHLIVKQVVVCFQIDEVQKSSFSILAWLRL
ncbi:hypothetical protein POM88_028981 [Heracleum sosnowskyi]|uniref:Uncharacterized protein n=1 Tax=Heracleum sosnowskyi TaxID=360622 RepID=A0AAD8HT15_9APIA|nr:hypothetical protein POM88_028978 [Heracleum sosnowskyi]KAK1372788.1 hypothetical protein POM88_028981 [Heracleum sosnowskyi]